MCRNLSSVTLCLFSMVCVLSVTQIEAQDAEKYERIKAGRQFLSNSRLDEWERCLREAPQACGKISFYSAKFNYLLCGEGWFEYPYILKRNHGDGKQLYSVTVNNPKYFATIDFANDSPNLNQFNPRVPVKKTAVPFSSFSGLSNIHNNSGRYIFDQLRTHNLQMDDYRYEGGYHFVKLVPEKAGNMDLGGVEMIELRFDERYLPLPDTRISKREGRLAEISISREFVEAGDFWVPTRFHGRTLAEGEAISYEAPKEGLNRITIEPDVKLDKSQCYLEYYGLPEPEMAPVADFGRKPNRVIWIASAVGLLSLLALIYLGWQKRKKDA